MRWFLTCCLALGATTVAAQTPSARSSDEAAILETVRQYVSARDLRDPQAIGALFTADADQHTTTGDWRRGRDAIVPGTLASSQRNPGRRTITVESVRFISADVAIVDGPYEIGGAGGAPGRRMWATLVLGREGGAWRIAAIRNMVPTGTP